MEYLNGRLSIQGADAEVMQVQDMLRGIRQHAHKLLKQLQEGDVERAQLGLGHAYSRARVKFSVQKVKLDYNECWLLPY